MNAMKTIVTTTDRDWFGLVSLTLKSGILLVWPILLVLYLYLDSLGQRPIDVWSETRQMMTYANNGYWTACGCLIVMGLFEMGFHRRRRAVWNFAFAALALFVVVFFGEPLSAMPK